MNQHAHGHVHETDHLSDGRLVAAIALNLLLSVVEVVVGVFAGSLALMADAAHNFNDCMSLVIALIARRVARRRPDRRRTFGYHRAEVLGAFVNLLLLIFIGLFLLYESGERFFSEQKVLGEPMIIAASVALVVDLATVFFLYAMAKGSMNMKAGFLHNLADAMASIGVIIGGVLVMLFDWYLVDPILTVIISGYILWQSIFMLKRTISILMESVPPDLDLEALENDVMSLEDVLDIHDVHVWELDEHFHAMEAHVVIKADSIEKLETIKRTIKAHLKERFSIEHSTLEFELSTVPCDPPVHTSPKHAEHDHHPHDE